MNHHHSISQEDVLIALDQLDQTVEVMGHVIKRLKHQLDVSTLDINTSKYPPTAACDADPNALAQLDILLKTLPENGWH